MDGHAPEHAGAEGGQGVWAEEIGAREQLIGLQHERRCDHGQRRRDGRRHDQLRRRGRVHLRQSHPTTPHHVPTWNGAPCGTGLTRYICCPICPYGVLPPKPGVTMSSGDDPYTGPCCAGAITKLGGACSASAIPPPPIGDVRGSMNGECCVSACGAWNAPCRASRGAAQAMTDGPQR